MDEINADLLLKAYMCGVFPMSESRSSASLHWVDPKCRGILPLRSFHIPKSLIKTVRKQPFDVRVDSDFAGVMRACAQPRPGHEDTWINDQIMELYQELFTRGYAHSVECWQDGELVGGLYGVDIGAAFFGESMFHTRTDASKIALCYLVARLLHAGYGLLDTQFVNEHLQQFGAIEISREEYHQRLDQALLAPADFHSMPSDTPPEAVLQLITQIS